MSSAPRVTVIGGPTAGGKTALAIRRAQDHDGIIINADSMQIYDALPLLTAQPSAEERAAAPHRLYGALLPAEKCTAMRWRTLALSEIAAAQDAGKTPIIVGGTGLYIKALIEGLSPIPDVPDDVRAQIAARQQEIGNEAFHVELEKLDPVMAARLQPGDTQRLIRAREVLEATGQSLAVWQDLPPEKDSGADLRFDVVLVMPEREALYDRCNRRFLQMIEQGVLDEADAFCRMIEGGAVPEDAPVLHALGFRPLRDFLRGAISRDEAIARAQAETRQYAKRQGTWFRHQVKPHPAIESIETVESP